MDSSREFGKTALAADTGFSLPDFCAKSQDRLQDPKMKPLKKNQQNHRGQSPGVPGPAPAPIRISVGGEGATTATTKRQPRGSRVNFKKKFSREFHATLHRIRLPYPQPYPQPYSNTAKHYTFYIPERARISHVRFGPTEETVSSEFGPTEETVPAL